MKRPILAVMVLGLAAMGGSAVPGRSPRLLWNATASAPTGLWAVRPGAPLKVGDWVVAWPPPALVVEFSARGYLPAGVPLLKRIAAMAPSRVCRHGLDLSVDGKFVARALDRDHLGRALPTWTGCVALRPGEALLLNARPDSLDGRYFGPTLAARIMGTARPLWVEERR